MSPELLQLEADYYSARRARDSARRKVATARAEIPALVNRARLLHQQALVAQALHDQQQAHADAAFRKNQQQKGAKKVRQRNHHGQFAREARIERDRIQDEAAALEAQAESLARLLGLYQLNLDFVVARHRWMARLAEEESHDAVLAKLEYARLANVPDDYVNDPGSIWMYAASTKMTVGDVHIFYGGGVSPTGEGVSPDGVGHAHHVLVPSGDGTHILDYARYLDGKEFRRADEQ